FRVSGHLDLLVFPDGTIQDYKFTSAWTVAAAKKEGKIEWERQLNVYRFLLQQDKSLNFAAVRQLQIVAMLRDYGPRHVSEGLKPVEVLDVPLWEDEQVETYIKERVALHRAAMGKEIPPQCTPEERWTNKKGEDPRCDSYCAFGKQHLCPYKG
ncbi:MAG: PD-(D/E)XK nuclease family protein, partial [Leptolyngbyaceae cyanobacterium bins.302]|nr:PD-(D/E)XK nuclease family protein [Leptolyngbyaceae cyanobacterium bins.302]